MNFMETPVPGLEENGKMTESQLTIAVAFVTEFIRLGVLALGPLSYTMFIGIFIMRPLRVLTTFKIFTTQDWLWELQPKHTSADGNTI
jgi:hypothetical protein